MRVSRTAPGRRRSPSTAIERVADLDHPPGNIAVTPDGRVFFTFHPDGGSPVAVAELRDGKPVPFPPGFDEFQSVLSLRVDRQGRLWALDHGRYGRGQPRILAFDPATGRELERYDFPSDVAGLFSMLNDFQVDPAGEHIYIAESSPIIGHPALIVYDTKTRTSRRLLHRHPSVSTEDYRIQAPGRDMVLFGLFTLRIGVDTIALDRHGEWLYYGPVTGGTLYRVRTADLNDTSLSPEALGARVEPYAAEDDQRRRHQRRPGSGLSDRSRAFGGGGGRARPHAAHGRQGPAPALAGRHELRSRRLPVPDLQRAGGRPLPLGRLAARARAVSDLALQAGRHRAGRAVGW